jgi:hypothetical protein
MSTAVKMVRKAIHDKIESRINTAEAKLGTLKARTTSAKADVEIKAVTALLNEQKVFLQKLRGLKNSGGTGVSKR